MAKAPKAAGSKGGEERVERDAVAELLAAPPEEFTARRDALARQLTADGHKDVAARVRALKKPTRPVWAVNRLAHEAADEVEALLAAAAELEAAQQRLMSGKADAAALRDASSHHRQRLRTLRARAAKLLDEPASSGSAMLDRVEATLNGAASGGEGLREALRAGRLTGELSPPTFGVLGGFEGAAVAPATKLAAAPATAARKPMAAARKNDKAAARKDDDARAAREAEARRQAEAHEREAAAAREEAKAAAEALDAAERAVVDAEARVQALEAELKDARDAVARTRLEARSAARAAKAAAQRSQRLSR